MVRDRTLQILKILKEKTDESNALTIKEIINILEKNEEFVTRNTVRTDINALISQGFKIVEKKCKSNTSCFYFKSEFSKEECRIILDSIYANKFLKIRDKNKIRNRILENISDSDKIKLKKFTVVKNINTENIDINENLYLLQESIENNFYIDFFKNTKDLDKKIIKNGEVKNFIPKEIYFYNNRYYIIGLNNKDLWRHYRLDRISNISFKNKHNNFEKINLQNYDLKNFDMFRTEKIEKVYLKIRNTLINSIIEKLGEDVFIRKCLEDEDYFIASKELGINKGLIRWILKQGSDIQVISPKELIDDIKNEIEKMSNLYK